MQFPSEISGRLYRSVQVLERRVSNERFSFALSSCRHRAGTTTVAWNLVRYLNSFHEEPVVLVEANLRSPCLADSLGLGSNPGFHQVATGSATLDEAVQFPGDNNVPTITAGVGRDENSTTLSQMQLRTAVSAIRERYAVSVFDTAPLLAYPDTVSIARHLDGMVLVLQAEQDKWEVAKLAIETASDAGVNTLGSILNKKPLYIPNWLYGA